MTITVGFLVFRGIHPLDLVAPSAPYPAEGVLRG